MPNDDLWAITTLFNPAGYRRRRENYRVFREHLKRQEVPLVAVELSFGKPFTLGPDDAEILIQLSDGDVMFQKERLLNIALAAVPPECGKIAWIDCDVVFADPSWPADASRLLDAHALIQLFSEAHHLLDDLRERGPADSIPREFRKSAACAMAQGIIPSEFVLPGGPEISAPTGFAWAARRDLLETHGFYDRCIIGGGDNAMACAAFQYTKNLVARRALTPAQREDYLAWALPFQNAVHSRVGLLEGIVYHLWHGTIEDRRYTPRHFTLSENAFAPRTDIALGPEGCWKWASDKPALHQLVRDYFLQRHEDR